MRNIFKVTHDELKVYGRQWDCTLGTKADASEHLSISILSATLSFLLLVGTLLQGPYIIIGSFFRVSGGQ